MTQALRLAHNVKGDTYPNPAVGAIITKNGQVVGKGATQQCGGPHAEIVALRNAGGHASNATMIVTLEPCNHHGKTPPCTEAIIKAGIKDVVIAVKDQNPLVNGAGIRRLRRNGIAVRCGLLRAEAFRLNEEFFWSVSENQPWITLKLAMTLDGRIADVHMRSKWITNKQSRTLVHQLRKSHAAIAIGSGTLAADDPMLTVRHIKKEVSRTRIIFASSKTVLQGSRIANSAAQVPTIVVLAGGKAGDITKSPDGATHWHTGPGSRLTRMKRFLAMAQDYGITSILVEGGSRLSSFLLENSLVNRLYVFYGNCLLGRGLEGVSFQKGLPIDAPVRLKNFEQIPLAGNLAVTGLPRRGV